MRKTLMGCVMLLAASILPAQQFSIRFTSKTPFAVGGATLPAGTYQIRAMEDEEGVFECQAVAGSPSVLFEADQNETVPTETGVTFAKYGNTLIMKGISIAGDQAFWIPASLTEKHTKKSGAKPTKVAVAANK